MNRALSPTELGALEDFHDLNPTQDDFRTAVIEGLSRKQKTLSSKFFYDRRGSELFDEITTLDEYYPTRTEIGILERSSADIAATVGNQPTVVEFGAGSVHKIRLLLDAVHAPVFVPIDISRDHLVSSAKNLAGDYPETRVVAICADFTNDIVLPKGLPATNRLGFFSGSTLGNFTRDEARQFLERARATLGSGSAFLVGIDLRKDAETLRAAYNDSLGITAAFNLNLLNRINHELDATFDLTAFRHNAPWVEEHGRIEMRLHSTVNQNVTVAGTPFQFTEGEYIHTENSHKYSVTEFQALARSAGYEPVQVWVDDAERFSLHYLRS
jgi:dimethylhistidine N-methyltransferase